MYDSRSIKNLTPKNLLPNKTSLRSNFTPKHPGQSKISQKSILNKNSSNLKLNNFNNHRISPLISPFLKDLSQRREKLSRNQQIFTPNRISNKTSGQFVVKDKLQKKIINKGVICSN